MIGKEDEQGEVFWPKMDPVKKTDETLETSAWVYYHYYYCSTHFPISRHTSGSSKITAPYPIRRVCVGLRPRSGSGSRI